MKVQPWMTLVAGIIVGVALAVPTVHYYNKAQVAESQLKMYIEDGEVAHEIDLETDDNMEEVSIINARVAHANSPCLDVNINREWMYTDGGQTPTILDRALLKIGVRVERDSHLERLIDMGELRQDELGRLRQEDTTTRGGDLDAKERTIQSEREQTLEATEKVQQ